MTTITAATRFAGGTALVTGGGAGIGEGLVRHLARIGMQVVIADIDLPRAEALSNELNAANCRTLAQSVDVADPAAVEALAAATFDRFGSLELLVNNAGLESGGYLWEVPVERWRKVMGVNVDGMFHCIRAFVPRMIAAGKPAVVVNLSSVGGVMIGPMQTPYIVSKHAVLAMTECLHQELALTGAPIQVSVVLPHMVKSRIFTDAQASAPSGNAFADQMFTAMQSAMQAYGMEAEAAAEHMMAGIAAGDFWIFSNDEAGRGAMAARAQSLQTAARPMDPAQMFRAMSMETMRP